MATNSNSFPLRTPQARNLDIFWAATLQRKSQGELAREHNISQQRVSQIVRAVRRYVALATSEQYDGVPQRAQLQLSCRIQLARLEQRRWEMARAWKESTRPSFSIKRVQGATGERVETVEKTQYGDWRIDRQLGEIDQAIVDTTRVLYEREWVGAEELRIADCGSRKGEGRKRKAESGKRAEEVSAAMDVGDRLVAPALVPVAESGHDTECLVLKTNELTVVQEAIEPARIDPAEPAVTDQPQAAPESAIRNLQSAIEPPGPAAAEPRAVAHRQLPVCSLTGRPIKPPADEHRPWRRVFVPTEWLRANAGATGITPEGVLWKIAPPLSQVGMAESDRSELSRYGDTPWDDAGLLGDGQLEAREMLVGV